MAPASIQPALAAAAATGYLVYPPLHPHETVEVRLLESGDFTFSLLAQDARGRDVPAFTVGIGGSAGWGGLGRHEVLFVDERAQLDGKLIGQLLAAMTTNVMPGTPGQFGFLGAFNFITPEGWNSLCMPVVNRPRSDGIPVLNCFIETDWYPQNTEFRYALKRGEMLRMGHDTALGQVVFVPRETVRLIAAAEPVLDAAPIA